jgi:N-acyl-D-amino-acid deacylase
MFDIVIKNGSIVDGTGKLIYRADIALKGDRIAKIGEIEHKEANRCIDVKGLIVAPGFVDVHSHSDIDVLNSPYEPNKITQGITTEIAGNCGFSLFPILKERINEFKAIMASYNKKGNIDWFDAEDYFNKVGKLGIGFNYVPLVGHGIIRVNAMGFSSEKANEEELEKMKMLVEKCMQQGVWGLSTGLGYMPGCFADTNELIELCKVVAKYGGIYTSHIRNQGEFLIESIKEAIEIGEESGVSVVISHIKAYGRKNWGKIDEAICLIEGARIRGVKIMCDFYPYTSASSTLSYELPKWLNEGGMNKFIQRISSEDIRKKVMDEMEALDEISWDKVTICEVKTDKNKQYEGKTVSEIAKILGKSDYDTVFDLIIEEKGAVNTVCEMMSEEDVKKIANYPYAALGSDAYAVPENKEFKGHPRNFGAFPRFLSRYVSDKKFISLEEAVRRMTSMPAKFFGIKNRGILKEGNYADIVIFDYSEISDEASVKEPMKFSKGIKYVIVNGKIQMDSSKLLKLPVGKVLVK